MKRFIALIMVGLFAYNYAGFYLVFKVLQNQVRKEIKNIIKQSVSEDELVVFHFSISTIHNSDSLTFTKPNEFRYHGEMYDIVKKSIEGDTITYCCINDQQESRLFSQLGILVKQHIGDNSQKRAHAKTTFEKVNKIYFIEFHIPDPVFQTDIKNFNFYINWYSFLIPEIDSPPPKKECC